MKLFALLLLLVVSVPPLFGMDVARRAAERRFGESQSVADAVVFAHSIRRSEGYSATFDFLMDYMTRHTSREGGSLGYGLFEQEFGLSIERVETGFTLRINSPEMEAELLRRLHVVDRSLMRWFGVPAPGETAEQLREHWPFFLTEKLKDRDLVFGPATHALAEPLNLKSLYVFMTWNWMETPAGPFYGPELVQHISIADRIIVDRKPLDFPDLNDHEFTAFVDPENDEIPEPLLITGQSTEARREILAKAIAGAILHRAPGFHNILALRKIYEIIENSGDRPLFDLLGPFPSLVEVLTSYDYVQQFLSPLSDKFSLTFPDYWHFEISDEAIREMFVTGRHPIRVPIVEDLAVWTWESAHGSPLGWGATDHLILAELLRRRNERQKPCGNSLEIPGDRQTL